MSGEGVEYGVTWRRKGNPEDAVGAPRDPVGKPWKIVEEDLVLPGSRPVNPVAANSIA
jgi:hypothetical protein